MVFSFGFVFFFWFYFGYLVILFLIICFQFICFGGFLSICFVFLFFCCFETESHYGAPNFLKLVMLLLFSPVSWVDSLPHQAWLYKGLNPVKSYADVYSKEAGSFKTVRHTLKGNNLVH